MVVTTDFYREGKGGVNMGQQLVHLGIPHIEVVLEEVFQLPPPAIFPECPLPETVQDLAQRTNTSPEVIWELLMSIRDKAAGIEIEVESLRGLLESEMPPVLLDVREPWEYAIAHLPGSLLLAELSFPDLLQELRSAPLVVTICHHGVRSFSAAMYLKDQGVEKVRSLAGGLDLWAQRIDRSMARY